MPKATSARRLDRTLPKEGGTERCKHVFDITSSRCAPCDGRDVMCEHYKKADGRNGA